MGAVSSPAPAPALVLVALLAALAVAHSSRGPAGAAAPVPCTYGPALPEHSISSCNRQCQTFYTLKQAEEACDKDKTCKGICAEEKHSNVSCSYTTFSPRTGKLQPTPATGPFHNQTAWLINNTNACGHGPPPPPPPPPTPSPSPPGPHPHPPPSLKQMPFPLPRNLTASGPPVQLAQAVTIVLVAPPAGSPPVPCGEGSVCQAILSRYETLLAVKTSGNFVGGSDGAVISKVSVVVIASSATVATASVPLPDTPEDYSLHVNGTSVTIQSSSIFGARAALETFAQMVANKPGTSAAASAEGGQMSPGGWLEHSQILILDSPVHSYRGLMIDTGRNFLALAVIKRLIVGMAMLKANVLHWHMTDDQSFPLSTEAYPELAKRTAFAPTAHYSPADLRDIVQFAASRGVRVLPEIETPGHGTCRSKAMPQLNLSTCPGVLNPTLPATYEFLLTLLSEVAPIFPEPTIFLGGDEVKYKCFDEDPGVTSWMASHCAELGCCGNTTRCSLSMLSYFFEQMQSKVMDKLPVKRAMGVWLADAGNAARGWNPPNVSVLPANALFNVYQSMETAKISLSLNRSTIVSVAGSQWYLDYKPSFEAVWNVQPCKQLGCDTAPAGFREHLLGGEVCAWGSKVDGRKVSLDTDIFAGGLAAMAERLWSDPPPAIGGDPKAGGVAAKARYHALACHWSLWGISTYDRLMCGGEIETKGWPCSYAGGSLSVTPVFGDGDCPSDWSDVVQ
jgi:hypothetical protein